MKSSIVIALTILLVVIGWMVSGQIDENSENEETPSSSSVKNETDTAQPGLFAVRTMQSQAQPFETQLIVSGWTKASRVVNLRAETKGRVIQLPVAHGQPVEHNTVIAQLAVDDRKARLTQAKALVEQRRIEYRATKKLHTRGFNAEAKLAEAKALLSAAQAGQLRIQQDINDTLIKAPFAGVLNQSHQEIGNYVMEGDAVATIIDLDPIIVESQVSEREIDQVRSGARGSVRLLNGHEVEGKVSYLSAVADAATRMFTIEFEVNNLDYQIVAGLTAELILPTGRVDAHRVPASILVLDNSGQVGIKHVDDENKVVFQAVTVIAAAADNQGMWVSGLPSRCRLIVVGQGFVDVDQYVRPIDQAL